VKQLLKSVLKIFTPLRVGIVLGVIAFLWFLLFGDQGIYQLNKLSMMKRRLTLQEETLKTDIERLTREKAFLQDPKNLEPVIRKELGFIRPGEIVYQEREEK
jgi:cell division protein FtsB